jgi:hypothetical protein
MIGWGIKNGKIELGESNFGILRQEIESYGTNGFFMILQDEHTKYFTTTYFTEDNLNLALNKLNESASLD